MRQRGPGEEERALGAEQPGLERRHRPRGVAEAHHHAARAEAVQRALERVLADRIVDHRQAFALGDLAHPVGEVLLGIDDRVIAAVGAGEPRLGAAADGPDHRRAQMLGPLAEDQPDPAGRGVDQNGVSLPDPVGLADQIAHGHALEHHRGRGLVRNVARDLDDPLGRDQPFLGIGAERRGRVGHPVARLETGHAAAERLDHARPLHAERQRKGQRVEPAAVVDVDIVEADGGMADADLALAGVADLDLPPLHGGCGARLVDLDCARHLTVSLIRDWP